MAALSAVAAPQVASELLPRGNPVFARLRDEVRKMDQQLRAEFDAGGTTQERLQQGNRGVRCYRRLHDVLGLPKGADGADDVNKAVNALVDEFRVPGVTTAVLRALDSAVDHAVFNGPEVLVALYAPNAARDTDPMPQADPLSTIYGGIPHELTELALRSDVLWRLKAPAMHQAETGELCPMHANTVFYLPSVEVRKESFDADFAPYAQGRKISVAVMADVPCVLGCWEAQGREDVNLSALLRSKLELPLILALRQNQNRKKLGLPLVTQVVVGDLKIPHQQRGVNTLFAQRVKAVLDRFNGCFSSISVCGDFSTLFHVDTLLQDAAV